MERLILQLEKYQVKIYFITLFVATCLGLSIAGSIVFESIINPALAIMLFVTFLQVPIIELAQAFKKIRFISALLLTQFMVLPLLVTVLIQFLPDNHFIKIAVLFVLLVPCIDYVITFTHVGQGNAKLLLAMTPLLLVLQMSLLPIYLSVILGPLSMVQSIGMEPFIHALLWFIISPLVLAAFFQYMSQKSSRFLRFSAPLNMLPVPATAFVLFVVVISVTPQIGLAQYAALQALPIYIVFAVIAPILGWIVATLLKVDAFSTRAICFSASYRNSFVILPLALAVPGSMPIIPAVILTQTFVELFFLPLYVRLIGRLVR